MSKNLLQQPIAFFSEAGNIVHFSFKYFRELFKGRFETKETLNQCFLIGNQSLLLVSITAFIIGLVLTMQARPVLSEFGAESWLPSMMSLSIVREIAPVITALIVAGKVGSGIGAELGGMKVTDQIDAMKVSGVNAYGYLAVTRITATSLMLPILVIYAGAISIFGAYMATNMYYNITLDLFLENAFVALRFGDVLPAFGKSLLFGFFIGAISCYYGFNAGTGSTGVGKASNASVVASSLTIFLIDMIAVQLTDILVYN